MENTNGLYMKLHLPIALRPLLRDLIMRGARIKLTLRKMQAMLIQTE
jgi:hypothetical protein